MYFPLSLKIDQFFLILFLTFFIFLLIFIISFPRVLFILFEIIHVLVSAILMLFYILLNDANIQGLSHEHLVLKNLFPSFIFLLFLLLLILLPFSFLLILFGPVKNKPPYWFKLMISFQETWVLFSVIPYFQVYYHSQLLWLLQALQFL